MAKLELVRIGDDYYNLNYLVEVAVKDQEKVTLKFVEGVAVSITSENWDELKGQIEIKLGVDNDRKAAGPRSVRASVVQGPIIGGGRFKKR